MTVFVRPARPEDAPALVALGTTVAREEGGWLLASDAWRGVADERRYLRALRRYADAAVYVATDDAQDATVVGRLSLARDPHPASGHVADLGILVAATHRRRGVGSALLEQAVVWALGAGITKIELHVFPWNEPALRLYERFGFEREGVRRRHYRRGGDYVDAVLMALHVDEHTS